MMDSISLSKLRFPEPPIAGHCQPQTMRRLYLEATQMTNLRYRWHYGQYSDYTLWCWSFLATVKGNGYCLHSFENKNECWILPRLFLVGVLKWKPSFLTHWCVLLEAPFVLLHKSSMLSIQGTIWIHRKHKERWSGSMALREPNTSSDRLTLKGVTLKQDRESAAGGRPRTIDNMDTPRGEGCGIGGVSGLSSMIY